MVTSWRDNASAQAQADLDALLNVALGFAQQQLAKHGEFFPYAVAIRNDNKPEMISAKSESAMDRPASADVIASCLTLLRSRRIDFRAAPGSRNRRRRCSGP